MYVGAYHPLNKGVTYEHGTIRMFLSSLATVNRTFFRVGEPGFVGFGPGAASCKTGTDILSVRNGQGPKKQ